MTQVHCGSAICSGPNSAALLCVLLCLSCFAINTHTGLPVWSLEKPGFQSTVELRILLLMWMFDELYFKYQRLLNKDNVCFFTSVFISVYC